jgi:hypothetical protein
VVHPSLKFATFAACGTGMVKTSGKWYYEYVPDHNGIAQVGWYGALPPLAAKPP